MIAITHATKNIRITSIDENMFSGKYFNRCMDNASCLDCCCSFGCPVDIAEAARILSYKDELEQRLGIPSYDWFEHDIEQRTEFPSGIILKTGVKDNKCIFHDNKERGCHLHRLALEKGLDPHLLKPMICFLFPLTWDGTYLHVSEFLDELPCKGMGIPIFEAQGNELLIYMGDEFYKEMMTLKEQILLHKKETDTGSNFIL
jgi:Fe-S-cluster containining protein